MVDGSESIRRARKLEASGDVEQALAAYRSVADDAPEFAHAVIRIVGIHLMRRQPDIAEQAARGLVAKKPGAWESHATLGQVLKFQKRFDEAIGSLTEAIRISPNEGTLKALLNDARRARYWSADPDLYNGLQTHVQDPKAGPTAVYRFFHCLTVGLLSPEVQHWLTTGDGTDDLPPKLVQALDGRFEGRFSASLREAAAMGERARAPGSPYAPAAARLLLTDGRTVEGLLEDTDSSIGAALETIRSDDYALVPFGDIESAEMGPAAPYIATRIVLRAGKPLEAGVPILYYFTEACRRPDVREGRVTLWRRLAPGLQVGLGRRAFSLHAEGRRTRIDMDRIRRIDFTAPSPAGSA